LTETVPRYLPGAASGGIRREIQTGWQAPAGTDAGILGLT
jgi:hypothetical protein